MLYAGKTNSDIMYTAMKYKTYSKNILKRLNKEEPTIEWSIQNITVKGRETLVVEAYNPYTEKATGISLGKYPTTLNFDNLINTLIAQAQLST